jgi:hypothetical protein
MSIIDRLPRVFPRREVRVTDERHLYRVFQTQSKPKPKHEYVLDKAPVLAVEQVVATVNGTKKELAEGTDYTIGSDNETIDFSVGGQKPDAGTEFAVTYVANSIISRYTTSFDDEISETVDGLDEIRDTKSPNTASEDELDEIGRIFGILGKRRGRDDDEYRAFIKSIVQSFGGRGTVSGIKFAISAATGVEPDNIIVEEDFQSNSYNIIILPSNPLDSSIISRVADIADPSAVELELIKFSPEVDTATIADTADYYFSSLTYSDALDGGDSVSDIRTRSINSARWEPQTATHEVRWDFFEWTDNEAFFDLDTSYSTVSSSDTENDSEFVVAFNTVDTQ